MPVAAKAPLKRQRDEKRRAASSSCSSLGLLAAFRPQRLRLRLPLGRVERALTNASALFATTAKSSSGRGGAQTSRGFQSNPVQAGSPLSGFRAEQAGELEPAGQPAKRFRVRPPLGLARGCCCNFSLVWRQLLLVAAGPKRKRASERTSERTSATWTRSRVSDYTWRVACAGRQLRSHSEASQLAALVAPL